MSNVNKPWLFRGENGEFILFFSIFYWIFGLAIGVNIFTDNPTNFPVYIIIVPIIYTIIFVSITYIKSDYYCPYCKKRIHPIFREHVCAIDQSKKIDKKKEIMDSLEALLRNQITIISKHVTSSKISNLLNDAKEKLIFKENLISLRKFELLENYKYSIIGMGAILEFLLVRYSKRNNFTPIGGDKFFNYLESAVKNDILGQKRRWEIVRDHLRDFRNFIHIDTEMEKGEINEEDLKSGRFYRDWYTIMKPVFESLLDDFTNK